MDLVLEDKDISKEHMLTQVLNCASPYIGGTFPSSTVNLFSLIFLNIFSRFIVKIQNIMHKYTIYVLINYYH